jgi:predicted ATP-dependent serine protease
MAKTELKTDTANWVLRAAAILGVLYGFGFLLMPYSMFQLSGDPGVPTSELLLRVCTKLLKIRRKIRNRTMTFVARAVTVP